MVEEQRGGGDARGGGEDVALRGEAGRRGAGGHGGGLLQHEAQRAPHRHLPPRALTLHPHVLQRAHAHEHEVIELFSTVAQYSSRGDAGEVKGDSKA